MKRKYLWGIILAMEILLVYRSEAQEFMRDSISVKDSINGESNLRGYPVPFSFQIVMQKLLSAYFQGMPVGKNTVIFNSKNALKYYEKLPERSSLITLPVYPSFGDYHNFGGTLGHINLANHLVVNYGVFISAQYGFLFSTHQIVFGSNAFFKYSVTNRLQLQSWGQYVTPGNSSDPTFNMRSFFPMTNLGAGLQYYSGEKSKIKVGIEYQYDQRFKKWKPESGGKVLLNF
jgi:hypothetical protein